MLVLLGVVLILAAPTILTVALIDKTPEPRSDETEQQRNVARAQAALAALSLRRYLDAHPEIDSFEQLPPDILVETGALKGTVRE